MAETQEEKYYRRVNEATDSRRKEAQERAAERAADERIAADRADEAERMSRRAGGR